MTRSDEPTDPGAVARAAVEVLVFAPLGLGAMLVEDAPRAVGRARRELSNARFVGRLAVDQGVAQLRRRIEAPTPVEKKRSVEPEPARSAGARPVDGPSSSTPPEGGSEELCADTLALPDYDTLPAIDIVAKLDSLTNGERAAIERYETEHRSRRTILGKLAQLAEQ